MLLLEQPQQLPDDTIEGVAGLAAREGAVPPAPRAHARGNREKVEGKGNRNDNRVTPTRYTYSPTLTRKVKEKATGTAIG